MATGGTWFSIRSKLKTIGRELRDEAALPMANFIEELTEARLRIASPEQAARAALAVVRRGPSSRDFMDLQKLCMVSAHLELPTPHSSARTNAARIMCLPHLQLEHAPEGTRLCNLGAAGTKAYWLLGGSVQVTDGNGNSVTSSQLWLAIGVEALLDEPYRFNVTVTKPAQLISLRASVFQTNAAHVAAESYETVRLQELLLTIPSKRTIGEEKEICQLLRLVPAFATKSDDYLLRLAAVMVLCACPEGTVLVDAAVACHLELTVLQGSVAVVLEAAGENGRDVVLRRSGDMVFSPWSACASSAVSKAVCSTFCVILSVSKAAVERIHGEVHRQTVRDKIACLRRLDCFQELPEKDLFRVMLDFNVELLDVGATETVLGKACLPEQVLVVVSGRVALARADSPRGQLAQTSVLEAGDVVTVGTLMPYAEPLVAIALVDSKLLAVDPKVFQTSLTPERLKAFVDQCTASHNRWLAAAAQAGSAAAPSWSDAGPIPNHGAVRLRPEDSTALLPLPVATGNQMVRQRSPVARTSRRFAPARSWSPRAQARKCREDVSEAQELMELVICAAQEAGEDMQAMLAQNLLSVADDDEVSESGVDADSAGEIVNAGPQECVGAGSRLTGPEGDDASGGDGVASMEETARQPPCQRFVHANLLSNMQVRRPESHIWQQTCHRGKVLLSCAPSAAPRTLPNFDCKSPDRVAIVPVSYHMTEAEFHRLAATGWIRAAAERHGALVGRAKEKRQDWPATSPSRSRSPPACNDPRAQGNATQDAHALPPSSGGSMHAKDNDEAPRARVGSLESQQATGGSVGSGVQILGS